MALSALSIKEWFNKKGRSPWVIAALFFISLLESVIFPIPPDPFLLIAVTMNKKQWFRLSASVFVGSIIGAIIAYVLGRAFFDTFGKWMIDTYSLQDQFVIVQEKFRDNTFLAVLLAAFTPIPYKLFTLAAGFMSASIFQFLLASFIGRGLRFFTLGFVTSLFGEAFYNKMSKKVELAFWILFAVVVLASIIYAIWHFAK